MVGGKVQLTLGSCLVRFAARSSPSWMLAPLEMLAFRLLSMSAKQSANRSGVLVDTVGYPRMSSELPVGRCRRGNG